MANRTDKQQPTAPGAQAERNPNGTWKGGGASPNPSGLNKTQREWRAAFIERTPRALELLDKWLLDNTDVESQRFAVKTALERGLGLPVKASELPVLVPAAPTASAETQELLVRTRRLYSDALGHLESQAQAGELPGDVLITLGNAGNQLAGLLKAEKEARDSSPLAGKPPEELLAEVPQEVLEAEVARRKGHP